MRADDGAVFVMRAGLVVVNVVFLAWGHTAWAGEEPGGPRLERTSSDVEPELVVERVEYVRVFAALQMMLPVGVRGGYLPIAEIDDAPSIALSAGYTPSDGFLIGARLDIGFGGTNTAAWNKILGMDASSVTLHGGPMFQLRGRPIEDLLVYVGGEFLFSSMTLSGRVSDLRALGKLVWFSGESVEIDYFGISGGATIGVAYLGITFEARYVRSEWLEFAIQAVSLEAQTSSDQIFVALGYGLSL